MCNLYLQTTAHEGSVHFTGGDSRTVGGVHAYLCGVCVSAKTKGVGVGVGGNQRRSQRICVLQIHEHKLLYMCGFTIHISSLEGCISKRKSAFGSFRSS